MKNCSHWDLRKLFRKYFCTWTPKGVDVIHTHYTYFCNCQGIFVSLKQCKSSCSVWREFIERRVWGSKSARRELHRKLVNRWRSEEPVRWDLS